MEETSHSSSGKNETKPRATAKSAKLRAEAVQSLIGADFGRLWVVAVPALSDRSPLVRITAIEVLADSGQRSAISKITRRLTDPNAEVRMRAAEALGTLPNDGKIPKPLIDLLKDKDVLVRVAAAESLGSMRNRRALPALRRALDDRSPLVRSYAAEALGRTGEKADVQLLKDALAAEENEIARVGICKALYELGEKEILQSLLMVVSTAGDYRSRCAAANALAELRFDKTDKQTTLKSLRRALRAEGTVAARSSIQSSIATLNSKRS